MKRLTIAAAKAIGKQRGFSINSRPQYNEFRVNFLGGTEETAYYTNDLQDALDTGVDMTTPKPFNASSRYACSQFLCTAQYSKFCEYVGYGLWFLRSHDSEFVRGIFAMYLNGTTTTIRF